MDAKLGARSNLRAIKPRVLSVQLIPAMAADLALQLGVSDDAPSVGLMAADLDDSLYVALDAATKAADVSVAYARSLYGGSASAPGPFSGEVIGVLSGPNPAEVRAGLETAVAYAEEEAWFYDGGTDTAMPYFAHSIARSGSYLSQTAGVAPGTPMAYLVAPPVEATLGLDAALKSADVSLEVWFPPPSETNFSGGILSGTQSACMEACRAFEDAVIEAARAPRSI
jgi:ethanolamine utilization protein EutL